MTSDLTKQILRELAELRAQLGTVWCRHAAAGGGGSTAGSALVTFLSDATEVPAATLGGEVTDGGTGDKTVAITPGEFYAFLFAGDSAQTYEYSGPDPAVTIKNYYLDRYIFPANVWFTGTAEEVDGEYVLIELSCAYQIKE